MTLSLFLCDGHNQFRDGLACLIARKPNWEFLAQAGASGGTAPAE